METVNNLLEGGQTLAKHGILLVKLIKRGLIISQTKRMGYFGCLMINF